MNLVGEKTKAEAERHKYPLSPQILSGNLKRQLRPAGTGYCCTCAPCYWVSWSHLALVVDSGGAVTTAQSIIISLEMVAATVVALV